MRGQNKLPEEGSPYRGRPWPDPTPAEVRETVDIPLPPPFGRAVGVRPAPLCPFPPLRPVCQPY
jgi:hypothetical protein